jgi:hypothetical protein
MGKCKFSFIIIFFFDLAAKITQGVFLFNRFESTILKYWKLIWRNKKRPKTIWFACMLEKNKEIVKVIYYRIEIIAHN